MASNSFTTPTQPMVGIGGRCLFRARSPSESSVPDETFYNSATVLRNVSSTKTYRVIQPAPLATLPGSLGRPVDPLPVLSNHKKPTPPFIDTVKFMRKKLYEVAKVERNDNTEPPNDEITIFVWKKMIEHSLGLLVLRQVKSFSYIEIVGMQI